MIGSALPYKAGVGSINQDATSASVTGAGRTGRMRDDTCRSARRDRCTHRGDTGPHNTGMWFIEGETTHPACHPKRIERSKPPGRPGCPAGDRTAIRPVQQAMPEEQVLGMALSAARMQ